MEIFNKISTIFSELCGAENICPEHNLQSDLALDSLQMITLLMMVEDSFNIVLDESDMNPFDLVTVQNIVDLVEKYVGDEKNETQS